MGNTVGGMCKMGAEHLEALRDGRAVYIDGERVADVTTDPAFRNAVHSAAALYDPVPPRKHRANDICAGGGQAADQ